MSPFDIAVLAIIGLSGLIAFWVGCSRVIFGIGGWVGAAVVTAYGFPLVQPFARQWIGEKLFADIAAGAGLFVVALVLLTVLSHAISNRVKESSLGALDRTLGLAAGLAIGAVIISGGYILYERMAELPADPAKQPEWIRNARTLPLVQTGARTLWSILPEDQRGKAPAARKPIDPEKDAERMSSPQPNAKARGGKDGYTQEDKANMDRLFQTHQD